MTILNEPEERPKIAGDPPHVHFSIQKPILDAVSACKHLVSVMKPVRSVVELFGGSGWQTLQIQRALSPKVHIVLDNSQDCIDSIRASLPQVKAMVRDSFALARAGFGGLEFDYVAADFNQYTYNRDLTDPHYRGVMDGIFKAAKRYVTLADSAWYGVMRFQKNRESYAASIGMDPDDPYDYFRATSRQFQKRAGFGIARVVYWGTSSEVLLERGRTGKFKIQKATKPVQFKILE
jgi:hypothetical protein